MELQQSSYSSRDLLVPVVSVILALLAGSVFILIVGENPVAAYRVLFVESFGSVRNIATTLQRATPLMFTGMAVAFAFRCGMFNIGAEGQLYVGAIVAAIVGVSFANLPRLIHLPLAVLAGMAAGGVWALVPGILKAKLGVHEVINTIMMNFVAYYLTDYLVTGPFHGGRWAPETDRVFPTAALARIFPPTRLNSGILLALVAIGVVYVILWKTRTGYEIRAVGLNPTAAEYGGISVSRNMILAMGISGALASLAGVEQVLGVHGRFIQRFSPELGFVGIAVALLGKNHPVGVFFAAILFGALRTGGAAMDRLTDVPRELVVIIQAMIIMLVAADELTRGLLRRRRTV
ncbi:MAG: ABC transporter permease [Spirochaetaceae bacterium]|nr:MAG: ABC transporter permease [Spirochaetaceae bacterium]